MNTRCNTFEFICETQQANELVSALFHTILFHRTYGKFNYSKDGSFSISSIGYEEVSCNFINFTYVRCNSSSLTDNLNKEISEFINSLRESKSRKGTITLEFYSKRNKSLPLLPLLPLLPFNENNLIWEQWVLKINCDTKRNSVAQRLEDIIVEKLMHVLSIVNNPSLYLPEMPQEHLIDTCFDTSHSDILPYLHKIYYKSDDPDSVSSTAYGNIDGTLKHLMKEINYFSK